MEKAVAKLESDSIVNITWAQELELLEKKKNGCVARDQLYMC